MSDLISDETLTAYLDGELDEAERVRVETALGQDDELAARLERLDVSVSDIRAAFEDILNDAPAAPEVAEPVATPRWTAGFVAAALVVIGIGIGAFWAPFGDGAPSRDWKIAVADYQALYVPQTLASPAPADSQAQSRLERLSQELGRDVTPALGAIGLDYRRAQMLGLDGSPLVQIAYLSEDNQPVAICITKVDESAYEPVSETLAGLAAAHWVDNGYGFLVIGTDDLEFVQSVAEDLNGQI